MRLPSKPVWLLIGVHSLCLSLGYWFMYQLVVSFTDHQAAQEAWTELAAGSGPLAECVRTWDFSNTETDLSTSTPFRDAVRRLPRASQVGLMLVNSQGRVMQPLSELASNDWRRGDVVGWQTEHNRDRVQGYQCGRLTIPAGNRVAVSYPVESQNAYLVIYDSQPLAPGWRKGLLGSLPLAAGIAVLWTWILTSVATYLLTTRLSTEASDRKAQSEFDALRSAQDLLRTRDAVIFGLAKLAESRDPETGHHLERISLYSTRLATAMRSLPKFHRQVTPGFIRLLGISSVLHDIGKVGLEDTVLLKPGRLNAEERKKMQEHTLVAGACLKEIEQRLGESNFLQTAREIALHHHERWDGNGYPSGLSGDNIPLAARIVTIADVYDALSSKRVYKDAFPHEECVRLIREGSGTQFDPELVEVFLSIEADFAGIARKFGSGAPDRVPAGPASTLPGRFMSPKQETILLDVVGGSKGSLETSGRSSSVA